MTTKTEISLDLAKPGVLPRVYAVQGEVDCRAVLFTLFENGAAWDGPNAPEVTVGFRRADGSGGYIEEDSSGNAAVVACDNIVTLMLTKEICAAAGPVMLTVELTEGASTLATWPLCVEVVANPGLNTLDGVLQKGPWAANRQLFTNETGSAVALEGYCELDLTGLVYLDFGNVAGVGYAVTAAMSDEVLEKLAAGGEIRPVRVKLLASAGPVWAVLSSRFDFDGGCLYSGVIGNPNKISYVSLFLKVTAEAAQLNFYPNQLGLFVRTVNGVAPDENGDVTVAGGTGGSGCTFTPAVDAEGNLSWSNDGGLENPATVNIMGPVGPVGATGDTGPAGATGAAGADGHTPVKGVDYCTPADTEEMVDAVLAAVPRASAITVDRQGNVTTMTVALSDDTVSTLVIEYGSNGDPEKITVDGEEIGIEFISHIVQLFSTGNVYEAVTGGWAANNKAKGTTTEQRAPTLDVTGAMSISLTTDKNSCQGSVMTANAIDLTGYSKLCFNVTSLGSNGKVTFGLTTDISASEYTMVSQTEASVGLNTIDLTGVTGSHIIAIAVTAYIDTTTTAVIDSVYLE